MNEKMMQDIAKVAGIVATKGMSDSKHQKYLESIAKKYAVSLKTVFIEMCKAENVAKGYDEMHLIDLDIIDMLFDEEGR